MNKHILLGIVVIGSMLLYLGGKTKDHAEVHPSIRSDSSSAYLHNCSGVDLRSEDSYYIATANCMGRLSGYVLGHGTTVEMINMQNPEPPHVTAMWCVPTSTKDIDLLNDVYSWVGDHPDEVVEYNTTYPPQLAAMAIATLVFNAKYPCSNT